MINARPMTNTHNPNGNNTYASAAMAYGSRAEAGMSGFDVTAKLYEGMIRFVGQAKNAHANGDLEEMVNLITKTNKILAALQSNLNFEEGGEASVYLNDLYMEVFKRLMLILRADDVPAEFDHIRDLLAPVAKMWNDHADNAKKANPDTHIQAPDVPEKS